MWNRKLIEGNLNIEILFSLAVQYSCSVTDVVILLRMHRQLRFMMRPLK